jgi:Flp pilus assembly protein TadD
VALDANRYDVAEMWFRRAERIDPRNAKTHFLLAKILWAEGRREGAQREIDFALQLEPKRREFNELKQELTSDSQP